MESDVAEKAFLLLSSSSSFDRGKKGRKALFSPFFYLREKGNKRLIFFSMNRFLTTKTHTKKCSLS